MMLNEHRADFNYSSSRKRPTNVSLDARLVDEAKQLGINVSRACEAGLASANKTERERRWREENAEAIKSFNDYIAEHGVPLARYRQF